MKRAPLLILGIVGVLVLWLLCTWLHRGRIERDLTVRTDQALQGAGLPSHLAAFEGRDAYLRGTVSTEAARQQAEQAARQVYGVRTVVNELVVDAGAALPDPASAAPDDSLVPGVSGDVGAEAAADDSVARADAETAAAQAEAARAEAARALEARLAEVLQADVIRFRTGTAELTAESREVLDRVGAELTQAPGIAVEVQGHTDGQGNASVNLELSQRRAEAVIAYLIGRGVATDRLQATGYGATRPVDTNETAAGRARNRRVEFVAQDGR